MLLSLRLLYESSVQADSSSVQGQWSSSSAEERFNVAGLSSQAQSGHGGAYLIHYAALASSQAQRVDAMAREAFRASSQSIQAQSSPRLDAGIFYGAEIHSSQGQSDFVQGWTTTMAIAASVQGQQTDASGHQTMLAVVSNRQMSKTSSNAEVWMIAASQSRQAQSPSSGAEVSYHAEVTSMVSQMTFSGSQMWLRLTVRSLAAAQATSVSSLAWMSNPSVEIAKVGDSVMMGKRSTRWIV